MAENEHFGTVAHIKDLLKRKGISTTAKKKADLIELVRNAGLYDDIAPCDKQQSERKRRKVDGIDLNEKIVKYTRDLTKMPVVKDGNVFAYLLHHCLWSRERLDQLEGDDGYKMFRDGHVEGLQIGSIEGHTAHMYIEGNVKPEQRQTEERYQTWVLASTGGQIASGGCQCVAADDGSCKHVTCLLFTVADFWCKRGDRAPETCTDKPMLWNKPRKESDPSVVEELDFRHDKKAPKKPVPTPAHYRPVRYLDDEDILSVRRAIQNVCHEERPDAIFLTLVDPAPQASHHPSLQELMILFKASDHDDFNDFMKQNLKPEHYEYAEFLKQGTDEWRRLRRGRITASVASEVLHLTTGLSCIDKILGISSFSSSLATRHGLKYESVARSIYLIRMRKTHKALKIEEKGLIIDRDLPCLAASPDGIVSCDCHGKKLIEIKCSYKHRDILPVDIPAQDPSYHVEIVDGQLSLKRTSPWFFQIQFQMAVINFDSCDFVLHTLQDIAVITIPREESVWKLLIRKSIDVFMSKVLPRL